jgi:hypothetical protein
VLHFIIQISANINYQVINNRALPAIPLNALQISYASFNSF